MSIKLYQYLGDGTIYEGLFMENSNDEKFQTPAGELLMSSEDPWEQHVEELHEFMGETSWEGDESGVSINADILTEVQPGMYNPLFCEAGDTILKLRNIEAGAPRFRKVTAEELAAQYVEIPQ